MYKVIDTYDGFDDVVGVFDTEKEPEQRRKNMQKIPTASAR